MAIHKHLYRRLHAGAQEASKDGGGGGGRGQPYGFDKWLFINIFIGDCMQGRRKHQKIGGGEGGGGGAGFEGTFG